MREKAKEVQKSLAELKAAVGAAEVALLDRRRWVDGEPEGLPEGLTDALEKLPCLSVDWAACHRDLQATEEHDATCGCGDRHQLRGVVIDRWVLLIVVRNLLLPDGCFEPTRAAMYSFWVLAIRMLLEDGLFGRSSGSGGKGGGGTDPAELAIPLWWHRKSHD